MEDALAGEGRELEDGLGAVVVVGTGGEEAAFGDAVVFGDAKGRVTGREGEIC